MKVLSKKKERMESLLVFTQPITYHHNSKDVAV